MLNGAAFRAKEGLSAIFDSSLEYGIVLNDANGTYWRLSRTALALLRSLASAAPNFALVTDDDALRDEEGTLQTLLAAGLVEQASGEATPNEPCIGADTFVPKASLLYADPLHKMPPLTRVIEYFVVNVRFRIEVLLKGWRPVRIRKARQDCLSTSDETFLIATIEEVLACMRIAVALPGATGSCIPRALAAYEICRRRGLAPRLIVGAYVEPFAPHIWVECGDQIIDTGHADYSLERFVPLQHLDFVSGGR